MNHHVRAIIRGRVQGVGYRNWVYHQAKLLNLNGWVRNLPSGEVELIAEGPESTLHTFVNSLKSGSSLARVTAVDSVWTAQSAPQYPDFWIEK